MSHDVAERQRACQLAVLILTFAAGKTRIMRAPLRVAYQLRFEATFDHANGGREGRSSAGRRSSAHLHEDLRDLERADIIRRRPGCIEILSFAKLVELARSVDGSSG